MITINRKNPTEGEVTSSLTNAEDGGLHFDGAAGCVNLGTSMPDLGTKYSLEFVVKGNSKTGETYLLDAYKSGARIIFAWSGYSNGNIQLHINGTWSSAFMATPDNGEVVHLILSVDGTSATLYKNGNAVNTQTVVANTMTSATSSHIGSSQNGTGNFFNGSILRTRFYNRTLSGSEIKEKFENKNLEFSEQWGSQTALITGNNSNFASGLGDWATGNNWNSQTNPSNNMVLSANAANQRCYINVGIETKGQKYRFGYDASGVTGTVTLRGWDGTGSGSIVTFGTLVAGTGNAIEFDTSEVTHAQIYIGSTASGDAITLDNLTLVQIGAVSSYELQTANPTQSLMVQDSSGAADGTCSASGISQIQPLTQLNSKAIAVSASSAFTPTDGHITTDCLTLPKAGGTPSLSFDYGSVYNLLDGAVTTSQETTHLAGRNIAFHVNANTANAMSISSAGVINIPNLSASSDVQTDGSKNLITSSDKRLKNDIGELTAGLDIINNLQPHYFSWKNDETNTQQLGFYAQDVYEFLPEAAPREEVTNEDGSTDYKWGFNGRPIIAALVASVKELKAKVEALENA
tara:strand:- start:592 stop:2319 length:1728 start_codon:yes stop_codon:yes gene_type:complete